MKILLVSNGYPPYEKGGTETYTQTIARALSHKHNVVVFARKWDYNAPEYKISKFSDQKVKVITVVNNIVFPPDFSQSYVNNKIDQIFAGLLSEFKPDLIHFQHLLGLSINLPTIAAKNKIPFLFTAHDYWYICPCIRSGHRADAQCVLDYKAKYPAKLTATFFAVPKTLRALIPTSLKREAKVFLSRMIVGKTPNKKTAKILIETRSKKFKSILKKGRYIITPSEFVKKKYLGFGLPRTKIVVLPHGVSPVGIKVRRLNNVVHFAYLGTFYEFKGLEVLVRAFANVNFAKAKLTIYSDYKVNPSFFRTIKKIAGKLPIKFAGGYSHDNLALILKDIDVVVVPSIVPESFNLVVREAQSAGIPVIASKIGALPEVIKNGDNGFLFEPGNISELTRIINKITANPSIIKELSKKAIKPMDVKTHVLKLEQIYWKIAK